MGLLDQLLGGAQQQQDYRDFTNRYDQGAPWDGISDQEALGRYQQVSQHLSPQEYEQSAEAAYAQLSPQQRMQVGQYLAQQGRRAGVDFPDVNQDGIDDRYQDPRMLAQMTSRMHQQQPGLVSQILGSALGGGMGGLMGGGMGMGGGTGAGSMGGGGMLDSPLAKAALAGVAAMAVKQMINRR